MLTFAEAYAIVCPNGGEVIPDSQEFKHIMELMGQETVVLPEVRPTEATAKPRPRSNIKISKREWLANTGNHDLFIKHLNKKNNKGSTVEPNGNVS